MFISWSLRTGPSLSQCPVAKSALLRIHPSSLLTSFVACYCVVAWQPVFLSTTTLNNKYVYVISTYLSDNYMASEIWICHDRKYTPCCSRFVRFAQQTSRKLRHYTTTLKTVVNKIIRKLKPSCTPRDFCPLVAGVLGLGDDVMTARLCWSDIVSVGIFS